MVKKILTLLCLVLWIDDANALCIVNRTQDTVAYVRGEPYAGMETYFTGTVKPNGQHCTKLSPIGELIFSQPDFGLRRCVRTCRVGVHAVGAAR